MKRIGNIYKDIISLENLRLADTLASKGKHNRHVVKKHLQNREKNLLSLQQQLANKTFTTSKYSTFTVYEEKERLIHSLPYYPDRVVHHAIMNALESAFVRSFTADTYGSIKGRGIYQAACKLKKALKDTTGTTFCLKLDIKKFYPSVDNAVLLQQLQNKIKDKEVLWLLNDIINSAVGLPIGNYLSQYLSNFYLTEFDRWIKENQKIKYYFRYVDDMVILSGNKSQLHTLLAGIKNYLSVNLKLTVKDNYQVFPVAIRGIDFLGYKFYPRYTFLRKSIKKRFAKMLARSPNQKSIAAYNGWLKHCNSRHLKRKLFNHYKITDYGNANHSSTHTCPRNHRNVERA